MAEHGRPIPPPRHLFPETAAFFIELKRAALRVKWLVTQDLDWFPAWTIGASCGVAGLMLAVMLFFMEAPIVAAVDSEPETVVVTDELVLPPEFAMPRTTSDTNILPLQDHVFQGQSHLTAQIMRTAVPNWDLNLADETRVSKPNVQYPIQPSFFDLQDPWRASVPFRNQNQLATFTPYAIRGMTIPVPAMVVNSADAINPYEPVFSQRTVGLHIEKSKFLSANIDQPATYQIRVRNASDQPIADVQVREKVSAIHRVTNAEPAASQVGDELVWALGTLAPGDARSLQVTIVPSAAEQVIEAHTEFFSSTSVGAQSHVEPVVVEPMTTQFVPREPDLPVARPLDSLLYTPHREEIDQLLLERTIPNRQLDAATETLPKPESNIRPELLPELSLLALPPEHKAVNPSLSPLLKLTSTAVDALQIGDQVSVVFTITNHGTAAAENVDVFVDLPANIQHRYGGRVMHHINRLEPGEVREALFLAVATRQGNAPLNVSLTMQGEEEETGKVSVPVRELHQARPQPIKQSQIPESRLCLFKPVSLSK